MILQGWIKLHRKLLCSPVWNEPGMLKLWIYCLMKSTHKEKEILLGQQIIKLEPGQFVTGRNSLHEDFNRGVKPANKVSAITLWRWLKMLEKMSNIALKTNNKFTVVTVDKWEKYQDTDSENEQQMNSKRTTNEQQMNTNKNVKNVKNDKKEIYRIIKHLTLTQEEFERLSKEYSKKDIDSVLDDIENYSKIKNYTSANLTARKWLEKRNAKKINQHKKIEQPWMEDFIPGGD